MKHIKVSDINRREVAETISREAVRLMPKRTKTLLIVGHINDIDIDVDCANDEHIAQAVYIETQHTDDYIDQLCVSIFTEYNENVLTDEKLELLVSIIS